MEGASMKLTAKQFKQQNAFWQDKYYSYAIHITDGGAMYLYRIEGRRIDKNTLQYMQVFRLDGVNIEQLFANIQAVRGGNA